jgi:hypothetical protein
VRSVESATLGVIDVAVAEVVAEFTAACWLITGSAAPRYATNPPATRRVAETVNGIVALRSPEASRFQYSAVELLVDVMAVPSCVHPEGPTGVTLLRSAAHHAMTISSTATLLELSVPTVRLEAAEATEAEPD